MNVKFVFLANKIHLHVLLITYFNPNTNNIHFYQWWQKKKYFAKIHGNNVAMALATW